MRSYRPFCTTKLICRWKSVAHSGTWLNCQCQIKSFMLNCNGNEHFYIWETMVFIFKLSWFKCQGNYINCRALVLSTTSSLNSGICFAIIVGAVFFSSMNKGSYFFYCVSDGHGTSRRVKRKTIVKFPPVQQPNSKNSNAPWIGKLWKHIWDVCSLTLKPYSSVHYVINWLWFLRSWRTEVLCFIVIMYSTLTIWVPVCIIVSFAAVKTKYP